jgi:hypothetical protein
MSGGQRQCLALDIVVMYGLALLLLDESASGRVGVWPRPGRVVRCGIAPSDFASNTGVIQQDGSIL